MRLKDKSDYSNNWFNKFIYTSMDFIGEIQADSMYGYSYFDEKVIIMMYDGEHYVYDLDKINEVYFCEGEDSKDYFVIKTFKGFDCICVENIRRIERDAVREPYKDSFDFLRECHPYKDIPKEKRQEFDEIYQRRVNKKVK